MAIEKYITSRTSGSGTSMSQVFLSNTIVKHNEVVSSPFNFDVPVYSLNGATFNYYQQTTDGISASLNNIKTVTFSISANTNSLTGTTKMKHDIYKIDYEIYTAFTSNPTVLSSTTNPTIFSSATLSQVISPTLVVSTGTTSALTQATINIISAVTTPFYTVYENVTGATFLIVSAHTLTLPQKIKPVGQYTQDFFLDKSQYFIDSKFVFETNVNQTIGDIQRYSGDQIVQIYDMPYSATTYLESASATHTITGGTFSGVTISGATFTYFVPPKKSDIFVVDGQPSVQGTLNTFAPIFSFKNVEDGDYYKVQVNYSTGDTTFTGETTVFKFQRQLGNAEYVRTVAAALTPNADFIYRIGNTKEIINLFNIKQNVTTWSEFTYARTSNDGTFTLSGHTWLNQINGSPVQNVILTLTILSTNSTVDLGSDTPNDPNTISEVTNPLGGGVGSTITITSDANGYFTFGKINGGQYTLTAQHTDPLNFPTQTFNFFLSTDTNIDIVFSILWGNTNIDFLQPYTFL